jgi:hypothetical protein
MYKIKIGRKYICFMSRFEFDSIKNSLSNALESLPDWARFSPTEKGYVIDRTFKSILKDLMEQFGMEAKKDYVDNLSDNETSADFVALSKEADELLIGLMRGKIIAISQYSRVSKLGNVHVVQAHFKKVEKAA